MTTCARINRLVEKLPETCSGYYNTDITCMVSWQAVSAFSGHTAQESRVVAEEYIMGLPRCYGDSLSSGTRKLWTDKGVFCVGKRIHSLVESTRSAFDSFDVRIVLSALMTVKCDGKSLNPEGHFARGCVGP